MMMKLFDPTPIVEERAGSSYGILVVPGHVVDHFVCLRKVNHNLVVELI